MQDRYLRLPRRARTAARRWLQQAQHSLTPSMWIRLLQQVPVRRATAGAALGGVAAAYYCCSAGAAPAEPALSKKEFRTFRLSRVDKLNHNVTRYRVQLPTPESEIGMVTSGMLMVRGFDESGQPTKARPYTPTSLNSTKGYFDLVIKHYPDGLVSKYVEGLKAGDQISVKGPYTKKKITPNQYKHIGLIAGGSGLTPMLQVARELCNSVEDNTQLTLLFCNQTPSDVYLRDELDELAAMYPDKFKVVYFVDKTEGQSWVSHSTRSISAVHGCNKLGPCCTPLSLSCSATH